MGSFRRPDHGSVMLNRLARAFARKPAVPAVYAVPDDIRVYAVGDIHGRDDLLQELHEQIVTDAADFTGKRRLIVYLGDYVDRGMESRAVIDRLLAGPLPDFDAVHLKGNHEAFMLDFHGAAESGLNWLHNGGNATLYSYGIAVPAQTRAEQDKTVLQQRFREALPAAHLAFLRQLVLSHEVGDYLFVHAGIRPGVAMAEQAEEDLIWIRGDFTNARTDHGRMVVHGHTITPEVDERANRIGIDTGAYATGRLTCLVLEGESRRYLTT